MNATQIVENYKQNILARKGPKCSINKHVTDLISRHSTRIKVSDIDETIKVLQAVRQTNSAVEAEYLEAQAELAKAAAEAAKAVLVPVAPVAETAPVAAPVAA